VREGFDPSEAITRYPWGRPWRSLVIFALVILLFILLMIAANR
jgi:hypothetical protein